jgi:very-short-patch-repair endonuclease
MRRRAWLEARSLAKPGAFNPKLGDARAMRRVPTDAEAALWKKLRNRRLGGWKFRRQQVVAGYIVDFYCAELNLAIEVDGLVHETQRAADAERDGHLGARGLHVMRVRNEDVESRLGGVLRAVAVRCERIAERAGVERRYRHRTPRPRRGLA